MVGFKQRKKHLFRQIHNVLTHLVYLWSRLNENPPPARISSPIKYHTNKDKTANPLTIFATMTFKSFSSQLPLITFLTISFGILKQIFFYNFFDVPISRFLEATEVLMLFTEDLTIFAIVYLLPVLITTLVSHNLLAKPNLPETTGTILKQDVLKWNKMIDFFIKWFLITMKVVIVLVGSPFLVHLKSRISFA